MSKRVSNLDLFSFAWLDFRCLFDLLHPHLLVGELAEDVKPDGEHEAQQEEDDSLRQVENIQDRVHPNVRLVLNHVNPAEVRGHEDPQAGKSGLPRRVVAEWCEQLHDDEDHNVRVHDVVQPAKTLKKFWLQLESIKIICKSSTKLLST